MLAALAILAPASAQIHDHRDSAFGMDHAMLASPVPSDGAELGKAPEALTIHLQASCAAGGAVNANQHRRGHIADMG